MHLEVKFAVVELNAKTKAWDAEAKTRELIGMELQGKQEELTKLTEELTKRNEEKAKLDEEIQKKRQELSEPQINKLDYFEAEVRRLEQKLT